MMAKHILRIVYSAQELNNLPDGVFQENQAVLRSVPFNPLSNLWKPGTSIIKESADFNKDRNFKQRIRPFSVLTDSYLNDKNSLNIYIEGIK